MMKKEVNRHTLRAIESSIIVLSLETDYVDPSVRWREMSVYVGAERMLRKL